MFIRGKHIFSVFTVILFFLVGSATGQQAQSLQYFSDLASRRDLLSVSGYRSLAVSEQKPQDMQLPEFSSQNPLFSEWASPLVQNGSLLIALDQSSENGIYDRLFIDTNNDGLLNDETAANATWSDQNNASFGPVEVTLSHQDKSLKYHLKFEYFSFDDTQQFTAYSDGQYRGDVTIGSETKECVLIDYNSNGTFNDKSIDPHQSDRIQIGKTENRYISTLRYCGDFVDVDGLLYQLEIAPDGSSIKLTLAENVSYGTVSLPEDIDELVVFGENGSFSFNPVEQEIKLPTGTYQIEQWIMVQRDEKDDQWKLSGSEFDEAGHFEVKADTEIQLNIGEPITCGLDIFETGLGDYTLTQILKGKLGEKVHLMLNGALPGDLKIVVQDERGVHQHTAYLADA
ncbi:MAG: hypothetical protein GY869_15900 [Planctomycetes bacterium]|nr:hypothetical protein [Planctomycetota bacterium]